MPVVAHAGKLRLGEMAGALVVSPGQGPPSSIGSLAPPAGTEVDQLAARQLDRRKLSPTSTQAGKILPSAPGNPLFDKALHWSMPTLNSDTFTDPSPPFASRLASTIPY